MRQRVLAGMLEGEAVGRLEHGLEGAPQRQRGAGGIGEIVENLGQLRHGRDTDLVEVERTLEQSRERLLGHLRPGVLQAAREQDLFEQRP